MKQLLETIKSVPTGIDAWMCKVDDLKLLRTNYIKTVKALKKIIRMNRMHAQDQYGDSEIAEGWACVAVAREALVIEIHKSEVE
jgi:hypothetical protein